MPRAAWCVGATADVHKRHARQITVTYPPRCATASARCLLFKSSGSYYANGPDVLGVFRFGTIALCPGDWIGGMETGLQLLMRDGAVRVTFRPRLTAAQYIELL